MTVNDKQTTLAKLRKAVEVIESSHIQSVKAEYVGKDESGIRIYNIETRRGFDVHRYAVRVQDWFNNVTNEQERWAKCNCRAGALDKVCRHVVHVAALDSEMFNRELRLDFVQDYNAHKFHKKAVA